MAVVVYAIYAETLPHRGDTHNPLAGLAIALLVGVSLGAYAPLLLVAGTWYLSFFIHLAADDMQSGINSQKKAMQGRRTRMANRVISIRKTHSTGTNAMIAVAVSMVAWVVFFAG
jgi:uncharacterized metal-binding protein